MDRFFLGRISYLLPFCYHNARKQHEIKESSKQNLLSLVLILAGFFVCNYMVLLAFCTLRIRSSGVRITLGAPETIRVLELNGAPRPVFIGLFTPTVSERTLHRAH